MGASGHAIKAHVGHFFMHPSVTDMPPGKMGITAEPVNKRDGIWGDTQPLGTGL